MVEFIFSWEEGVPIDEFAHDACDCPHINRLPILPSNQQLRRSVPPSSHVVSNILLAFQFELPRKAEVTDLQSVFFADQQILRLDIAMDDVLRVEVGEALEQLVDESADECQFESALRFL